MTLRHVCDPESDGNDIDPEWGYYNDDGGVCDEEQRFCAWSRELWRAWVADKPELPQTWEAEWQRGKAAESAAIEAVEA